MNYQKSDPKTIQLMFDSIAKRYDLTNTVLSFRLHRYWNRELVKKVKKTLPGHTLLDLCSGTGDIALEYLKASNIPCRAYFIDFSPEMLAFAKEKSREKAAPKHRIEFIEADVQHIPLASDFADNATMAYGIRNVKNPAVCIREAHRLLKKGGVFGILELTQPTNPLLKAGHTFYLRFILPILGKLLTDNQEAYRYLSNSIHTFIAPSEIEKMMKEAGFSETECFPLTGGIATIILGRKK